MTLYAFYPCDANGCAATFVCAELPDLPTALTYGNGVLAGHASALTVAVVQGERQIARLRRSGVAFGAEQLSSPRACIDASPKLLRENPAGV